MLTLDDQNFLPFEFFPDFIAESLFPELDLYGTYAYYMPMALLEDAYKSRFSW